MTTAHKLRNIGFIVDDEWLGTLLLAGLPDLDLIVKSKLSNNNDYGIRKLGFDNDS